MTSGFTFIDLFAGIGGRVMEEALLWHRQNRLVE